MKVSRPGPRPRSQSPQTLRNAASGTVKQSADAECRLIPAPHTDDPAPAADASPIAVRAGARPATISCGGAARSDRLVVRRMANGDGDDGDGVEPPLLRDAEPLFRGRFLVAVDMVTSDGTPPAVATAAAAACPRRLLGVRGGEGGEWREARGEWRGYGGGSGLGEVVKRGGGEGIGGIPAVHRNLINGYHPSPAKRFRPIY